MAEVKPRVGTLIRFPPGIHARLKRLGGRRERSINWLVVQAVSDYLRIEEPKP